MTSLDLTRKLRSALAHLDDPAYLETHALAQELPSIACAPVMSRGQMLRRTLRLAIESLDPGPGTQASAISAQCYQVLYRYAIAKQSVLSIANALDISERQAYRALERGIQALAGILRSAAERDVLPNASPASSFAVDDVAARLHEEIGLLATAGQQEMEIGEVMTDVIATLQPFIQQEGIEMTLHLAERPRRISTNRVMFRQAIMNLLSHVIHSHGDKVVEIRCGDDADRVVIEIAWAPRPAEMAAQPEQPYAVAQQLLANLGVKWHEAQRQNRQIVRLGIREAAKRKVFIIDDNEGMVALLERYLQHQPYQVFRASSADEALGRMEEICPDVILLDIMMPNHDGWETLQALRATETGKKAHVIICSVINDPELSKALGADSFLHKPIDRARLLQTLARAELLEEA